MKDDGNDRYEWALIASILVIVGIGVVFGAHWWIDDALWRSIISTIGMAVITAGLVEGAFGISFKRRLAQDVFKTAFGYILHPKLRNEINWLFSMPFLAVKYAHSFELRRSGNNELILVERVNKTVENITNRQQKFLLDLGVRAFHGGKIAAYQFTRAEGESWSIGNGLLGVEPRAKYGTEVIVPGEKADKSQYPTRHELKMTIGPGESFDVVHRTEEPMGLQGEAFSFSPIAASNPEIEVRMLDGLHDLIECQPLFTNRNQGELVPKGSGIYRLHGTLLPFQGVRLRWWKKDRGEDKG